MLAKLIVFLHQQTFAPEKIHRDKKNQLVHSYIYKESRYEKLKSRFGQMEDGKSARGVVAVLPSGSL